MKSNDSMQVALFQIIKEKLPSNVSFVHEISELLGISYDSAYRRIRGEKELTLEELKVLCAKYQVSLDALFSVNSHNIIFNSMAIGYDGYTLAHWLNTFLDEVKDVYACKQKEVFYSAKDIPVYHFFEFPELFAFKAYFWNKVLFSTPGFDQVMFRFDMVDQVLEIGKQILSFFNKIPVIELWNDETFNSLIRQIEFCYVCGYFSSKADALKILEITETMVQHLQHQAEAGFRFIHGNAPVGVDGNYKLYCNEVLLGDNTILILKDARMKTFLTYNVINLLATENINICRQVETSLRTLTKKSTLISSTSEKERNRFFTSLNQKINDQKAKIR
jgi:hypothetical protein